MHVSSIYLPLKRQKKKKVMAKTKGETSQRLLKHYSGVLSIFFIDSWFIYLFIYLFKYLFIDMLAVFFP